MRELEAFKMNMKYYRERNKWSQKDLAQRLNVSRPVITRLESGEQAPDLPYLLLLSKIYNISVDQLIGRDLDNKSGVLYEVYGCYDSDGSLSYLIDYLVKNPDFTRGLQQLLTVQAKERKHIEEMLMILIDKTKRLLD